MFENKRYTWRHNCLLLEIAKLIADLVTHVNTLPIPRSDIAKKGTVFVKAGAPKKQAVRKHQRTGLLHLACDWIFDFHMPEWETAASYTFPSDVALTNRLPDGVLISRKTKMCVIIELTAPLEENIRSWNVKKTDKYEQEIAAHCEPGWKVVVLALEIGAKGWIPSSFFRVFKKLGAPSSKTKQFANNCELLARKCSYLIWTNRFNKHFEPWRITISSTLDHTFRRKRGRTAIALSAADVQRIHRNREAALGKLKKKNMPKDKRYNCIALDYENPTKPTRSIQKEAAILSEDVLQRIKHNKEAALLKLEEKKQKSKQKPQEDCESEDEALDDSLSRYPDTLPSSSVTVQQLQRIHEQKKKAEDILKRKKREKTQFPPGPLDLAVEVKLELENCHEADDEEAAFLQDSKSAQNAEEAMFLQDLEEEAAFLQDWKAISV